MRKEKRVTDGASEMSVSTSPDCIEDARAYIKENYHIDSIFDKETRTIRFIANNLDYALNILAAREYIIEEKIDVKIITGEGESSSTLPQCL